MNAVTSEPDSAAEPVAIIGMSCRFAPDLDSPDKLWEYLRDGRSSVSEMPDKRWDPYAATSPQATAILRNTTRIGSFLDDIEGFDADFFGITPREAEYLDPQQRIMLELAWEALGDAGVPPTSLRGTEAGVYVAANSNDYGRRLLEDIARTGAWAVNGTTYYGIANRISYFLDLRGPSMAVDTACAGSLTALHVACASLRGGESPIAIVGGVNIMATPALYVALDAAGATAPDGRSKAFDKYADGYGRGEGAGVLVLKRLSDAQRDGDRIHALVLGSGVFQDGKSDGMMAPSGTAQEHMLRQVYRRAGVAPQTVSYVEAHGTGTPVGDREEAHALAAVFGADRPADAPCLVGSIKPNIGHTEAGSGVAGIIKAVLALTRQEIPPSLHTEPNPDFDWASSGLRLVPEALTWPTGAQPRRAGVSSYGVGGTTSHVILQEAPQAKPRPRAATVKGHSSHGRPMALFPLSAMSDAGLRALAGQTADWLSAHPGTALTSVGHTLTQRRAHLPQRAGLVAENTAELTEQLRALAEDRRAPGVVKARAASGDAPAVTWVFSGHGAQWEGMGRELLTDEPVFAAAMDALKGVFLEELGWTPRQAIIDGGPWTTARTQAMTFAMQIGLAEVWRRHGITPGAIIGHSVGEIAAAVVAGAIDLTEAARFACRRAAALQKLEGLGAMAMAALPFEEVRERLAGRTDVVAAISASPRSTVVSGDKDAVEALADQWREEGVEVRAVDTDVAFHSPHVDAVVAEVAAAADELVWRPAQVPLYTTALDDPRATTARDSVYWATNLRQPVLFAEAVQAAIEDGERVFLEVSSHPVVAHSIKESLEQLGDAESLVAISIRRNKPEMATLLEALAQLHCHGVAVDWSQEHPEGDLVPAPAMAWQHRPYWIFPAGGSETGPGGGHDPAKRSLLGGRMTVSGAPARQVWQTHLDLTSRPYPQDHLVVDVEITPAASIINSFMLAAARDGRLPALTDVVLRTPLAVVPPRVVQIVLAESSIRLASRIASEEAVSEDEENEWITHTTATIDHALVPTRAPMDPAAVRSRCPEVWDWDRVDGLFVTKGVGGYAFPWDLDELRRSDTEQLAILTLEHDPEQNPVSWAHVIDGALTISAVLVTPEDAPRLWMSCHIGSVLFHGEPPARITVHSTRSAHSPVDSVDVLVCDDQGRTVCEVQGLKFATLQDQGTGSLAAPRELVHEIVWRPLDLEQAAAQAAVERIVLLGDDAVTEPLAGQWTAAGVSCVRADSPEALSQLGLSGSDAIVVSPARLLAGEAPDAAAERTAWELVSAAQALVATQTADSAGPRPRLWTLTVGVRDAQDEAALSHGPLWGVSRIIAGEHPELWGGVVDLPSAATASAPDTGERLLAVLRQAAGQEDVISLADDGVAVARLSQVQRPADGPALQCRPGGTYLITGGLGALGLEVARWLADRGATRLVLAGRSGLPPRAEWDDVRDAAVRRQIDGVLGLEASGVTVRVLALDITDADRVAAALQPSALGMPPIRGIIHAAGVTRDAMLDRVDREGLATVLGPKAGGALVLHRLFPAGSLDFFVMFSSCGQFARLTGQTSYAAANSFLDTLAAVRHAGGHRETTAIGWTSWLGVGMAASIGSTMLEANSRGLEAVTTGEAFRAWAFADRFRSPYQAVLRVLPLPAHTPKLPMFRELTATSAGGPGGQEAQSGFTVDWTGLSEPELVDLVTADVREQVAAELNLGAEDVEPRRPLVEMGVDSVMAVALRVRLTRRYGLDLPPTILWNKPTVAALAGHLVESLRPQDEDEAAPEEVAVLAGV